MKRIDTLVIAVGGENKRLANYFKAINFNSSKTLLPINGKPLLKYTIDRALAFGYKRVFLLVNFYKNQMQEFTGRFYKDKNVFVVFGGKEGGNGGVTKDLSLIGDKLNAPFVYSDGDILFESYLLKYLSEINSIGGTMIRCVISPKDMADTHSKFIIKKDKLSGIDVRCSSLHSKTYDTTAKIYCSLGLMIINNNIFNFMPGYKDMNDLDIVVRNLFDKSNTLVDYKIYEGDWLSIHTAEDIDKIKQKCHIKLF